MQQKKINIKNKIINHLTCNGKKETSQKILLKTLKELQKTSLTQSNRLINLSIMHVTPIFKIHKIIKKRKKKHTLEIPVIINSNKSRLSLAIKFLLSPINNTKKDNFYIQFSKEILSSVYNEESSPQLKNNIQKQALAKKHLFYYYR